MTHRKQRDPHKERCWRRLVRQWRASGLSVRAFCQRHDVTEANFYAWRRSLAKRDEERPTFAAVQVVPEARDTRTPLPSSAALELRLDGGRVIAIPAGFDAETLRRLLALLAEGRPC